VKEALEKVRRIFLSHEREGDMTADGFLNRVKSLYNIDAWLLEDEFTPAQLKLFIANPPHYFISTNSAAQQLAIWREVEIRQHSDLLSAETTTLRPGQVMPETAAECTDGLALPPLLRDLIIARIEYLIAQRVHTAVIAALEEAHQAAVRALTAPVTATEVTKASSQ